MSTALLERPAAMPVSVPASPMSARHAPDRKSLVDQIEQELSGLPEVTFDAAGIKDSELIPHGPTAQRIHRFAIRRVSSLPETFGKIPAFAETVAIGMYDVPDDKLCSDHFGILAGKETFEALTHAAAGLVRSTVACRKHLPVLRGKSVFEPTGMVLPGYTLQSVVWITDINDKLIGTAEGFVQIDGYEVMKVQFGFRLLEMDLFARLRDRMPSAIANYAATHEGAARIIILD